MTAVLSPPGASLLTSLRFGAVEENFFRLIDLYSEISRASAIGVDQLHQTSVAFIDLWFRRIGGEAENLQGFRFRHEKWFAMPAISIALPDGI